MPLPEAEAREPLHTRSISYQGYRREDGLWDIEAHMTDVKSYSFQNHFRGTIEVGEAATRDAAASHHRRRFCNPGCDRGHRQQSFRELFTRSSAPTSPWPVIKMGPGWRRNIRQKVRRREWLHASDRIAVPDGDGGNADPVGIQESSPTSRPTKITRRDRVKRPAILDTCHAWAATSRR